MCGESDGQSWEIRGSGSIPGRTWRQAWEVGLYFTEKDAVMKKIVYGKGGQYEFKLWM